MKHAFYTGTQEVYGDMETAAKSLVANSDVDVVHFLIEDAAFPRELPDIVECHDVSGQEHFPPDGPNMKTQYSYMALMRAALWDMFPEVGRALVLDCDTIAVRDVSAAWDLELGGAYIAATLGSGTCVQILTDCDDGLMPPFTAHCSACGAEWGFTPKYCHNCCAKVVGVRDERKEVSK